MARSRSPDLTGKKFGRLTVLERVTDDPRRNTRWRCLCICGNVTTAVQGNLNNRRTKSCGCYKEGPTAHSRVELTYINGYAFAWAPDHPRANKNSGRVREHILVMEKTLGRYLTEHEQVHHINAVKHDNRAENLELWTKSQPAGARVADQIEWAIALLQQYAPEKLSTTQSTSPPTTDPTLAVSNASK